MRRILRGQFHDHLDHFLRLPLDPKPHFHNRFQRKIEHPMAEIWRPEVSYGRLNPPAIDPGRNLPVIFKWFPHSTILHVGLSVHCYDWWCLEGIHGNTSFLWEMHPMFGVTQLVSHRQKGETMVSSRSFPTVNRSSAFKPHFSLPRLNMLSFKKKTWDSISDDEGWTPHFNPSFSFWNTYT